VEDRLNKLRKKSACCWSLLSNLGVKIQAHVFLNLVMRSFTPLIFYLARSCVGPRTGLSAVEKIKITCPVPEINLNRSVVRPTGRTPADHYMHQTPAAIPALCPGYVFCVTVIIQGTQNFNEGITLLKSRFFFFLRPNVGHGLLILEVSDDAPQSVGLFRTSDELVAETSTWQYTTLTDKHPCPRWDSNPRSQQARPLGPSLKSCTNCKKNMECIACRQVPSINLFLK
jgi:hypothetical protein